MSDIQWLRQWYKGECDGDWEHCYGIHIRTLDNPGWSVRIDLIYTQWYDRPFEEIKIDNGDDDWIMCRIIDGYFDGAGDPDKLEKIISIFRQWVESIDVTEE